jgi:PAS domain S-box-containing protein
MAETAMDEGGAAQPGSRPLQEPAGATRLPMVAAGERCDLHFILDRDLRLRSVSNATLRALGMTAKALLGRTWQEAGLPAAIAPSLAQALRAGRGLAARSDLPTARGPRRCELRIEPMRDETEAVAGLIVAAHEVGECRQAEARRMGELERRRLDLILNNVSEAITAVFLDTGTTVRNRGWLAFHDLASFEQLPGWRLEEVAPMFEIFDADGRLLPLAEVPLSRALRGESFRDLEVRLRRKDNGRVWWGSYNGSALRDAQGKVVAAIISMRDTTERRRAEAALRESEERFRRAITTALVPIMLHAEDGEVLAVSEGLLQATGYTRAELARFEDWLKLAYRDRAAEKAARMERRFKENTAIPGVEVAVHTRAGEVRTWVWHAPPPERLADGRKCLFAIASDVTERKRAEQALRASKQRLEVALAAGRMGTFEWDLVSDEVSWDEQHHRIFGVDPDRFVPSLDAVLRLIHPDDRARIQALAERAIATGEAYETEFRIVRPDGEVRWAVGGASVTLDATGRAVRFTGVTYDITHVKQAEAALRQAEERQRLAHRAARVGTFEWNIQTDVNRWTPELEALYGLPPGGFGGSYRAWAARVHPDDLPEAERRIEAALADGSFEAEWRGGGPDGTIRWLAARGWVLKDEAGTPLRLVGVNVDITELKTVIEQRDRLLIELNHRVKNNLQLVGSLLKIQAARSQEPAVARLVEQTGHRIAAIAQVHGSLYQGDSIGSLEFSAYLRDLCSQLAQSFVEAGRVGLEVEARPLRLQVDQAIPLGLIVNELVTNAVKHGFANGCCGTVRVRCQPIADGAWRLEVGDEAADGEAGAAPLPDGELRGLGMQLVEGFARQLGGTLRIERTPRYRVQVDFPP